MFVKMERDRRAARACAGNHKNFAFADLFRVFNAQANLSRLSEETGAESYYLGYERPVTLSTYFDEIQIHLENQYLLTFAGSGGKRGKFERVRVMTEVPNVQFLTPSAVFLPPNG